VSGSRRARKARLGWQRSRGRRTQRRLTVAGLAAGLLFCGLNAAQGYEAWVRGGINLNLRTEPGTQFRIIATVNTGDAVDVVERGEKWTKIKLAGGDIGWIPAGYLQQEPPAELRVEQLEQSNVALQEHSEELEAELQELRELRDGFATQRSTQEAEIRRLSTENGRLEAGARYPELIAGASILGLGMIAGALLRGSSSRRQPSRIRL
jgi:hypothetical protein